MLTNLIFALCILSITDARSRGGSSSGSSSRSSRSSNVGGGGSGDTDHTYTITIEIEYDWEISGIDFNFTNDANDVIDNEIYVIPYSSLWANINELLSEFDLESISDKTSNKQNITYTLVEALNLFDYNTTLIWNMETKTVCDTSSDGDELTDYVNDDLEDDIFNIYDGYWDLLNIVDIECNITEEPENWLWIIIVFSVLFGICCCIYLWKCVRDYMNEEENYVYDKINNKNEIDDENKINNKNKIDKKRKIQNKKKKIKNKRRRALIRSIVDDITYNIYVFYTNCLLSICSILCIVSSILFCLYLV